MTHIPSEGTRLPRWLGLRACLALCLGLGLSLALAGCGDSSNNDKGSEGQSRNLRCAP